MSFEETNLKDYLKDILYNKGRMITVNIGAYTQIFETNRPFYYDIRYMSNNRLFISLFIDRVIV